MAYLEFKNVYKEYNDDEKGNFIAVKNSNIEIEKGELVVFVGPSGCGKSTSLRMLAGLEEISAGEIVIDGKIINDSEPKDRDIAMVFQDYALYPHMKVKDNLCFGLKNRKTETSIIDEKVRYAASILELDKYLDRLPKQLSGGQRQRVALGRALVRQPKVFLLDEPLSNLDAKLRVQTRKQIANLHKELNATMIYVTHDQVEAMTLGDKIVVMNHGEVQQIADPETIYNKPINTFVASFIGTPPMNILNVFVKDENTVSIDDLDINLGNEYSHILKDYVGEEIFLGIRPEHITIDDRDSHFKKEATIAEFLGSENLIYFDFGDQEVIAKINTQEKLKDGVKYSIKLDTRKIHLFDKQTNLRLDLQASILTNN